MALVRVVDSPIKEHYGERVTCQPNDASGATSGRRAINLRGGFSEIMYYASALARVGLCPRITAVLFYDASANTWQDLLGPTKAMLDSAQTGVARFTMDASDFIYIATVDRVGGFRIQLDTTLINNDASTLNLDYSTRGGFVNTAITDGMASGGATFGVGGAATPSNVTITTVPADGVWSPVQLAKLVSISKASQDAFAEMNIPRYWTRLYATAITGPPLDEVEIEQLIPLLANGMAANTAAAAGGAVFAQATTSYTEDHDADAVGAIEYRADAVAGNPTIDLSWLKR